MSSYIDREHVTLRKLIQDFFNGSLKLSVRPEDIGMLTWKSQQEFLEATINSELVKKYPMNSNFCRLFFKKLIEHLESRQEVHDGFYTYLCSVMQQEGEKEQFCYRHYTIGNDLREVITIKETNNMVVNGTTGMKTWEAALMLSDWALCNEEVFNNKKVLELGSGVGFTGITIAKLCKTECVLLTDCHSDVLKTIGDNIKINFPHSKEVDNQGTEENIKMYKDEKTTLGMMMLDWNSIGDLPNDVIPDILIGADVVYDPSILHALCNVIKTFCTRNKNLQVYIANIVRNEDTFGQFLKELDKMDLAYTEKSLAKSNFIQWDHNIQRCLLKIKNKEK